MAEGKKSFMFYCDWSDTFKALSKEDGYDLLIHLLEYVNDNNPVSDNPIVNGIFPIIRNQLKRDLKKWEGRAETSRENGKLGGRPPKKEPKKPNGLINNLDEPKKPVTVKVIDTVKDKVKDINKRKEDFYKSLSQFSDENITEATNFFDYWTEHGEKDRKMRFEKEKSFSLKSRWDRWIKNSEKWKKEKSFAKKEKLTAAQKIRNDYGLSNN